MDQDHRHIKQQPFSVPDAYFEQLHKRLDMRLRLSKDLESRAGVRDTKQFYRVPNRYFDSLLGRIQTRLSPSTTQLTWKPSLGIQLAWQGCLVAAILIILGIAPILKRTSPNPTMATIINKAAAVEYLSHDPMAMAMLDDSFAPDQIKRVTDKLNTDFREATLDNQNQLLDHPNAQSVLEDAVYDYYDAPTSPESTK